MATRKKGNRVKTKHKKIDEKKKRRKILDQVGNALFGNISVKAVSPKTGKSRPLGMSEFMDFLGGMACNDHS